MLAKVLEQVSKQQDPSIGLVVEGPVHFLVLNRPDNTFDFKYIQAISDLLDKVAASSGPTVLVTIGTGPKIFSSGLDFNCWLADPDNPLATATMLQQLLAKLLSLNVPTLCVMNGHAYAGGFFFGLCHDFRVLKVGGRLCLSEIIQGLPLPPAYTKIVSELLDAQISRRLVLG